MQPKPRLPHPPPAATHSPLRRRLRASARNALELVRLGQLGERYSAPFEVVDQSEHHRLRRYATTDKEGAPAALLVPPLMLTADVYDMAPDVSAVGALGARGVLPFVVDFGAPEHEAGGMRRTLDDHVRSVARAIERIRELVGRDVHLLGYSQGGMFAYQAAAYLRNRGIRSVVTFGSPVDIHRGVPALRSDLAAALVRFIEPVVTTALDRIEGLPGTLTSTAFMLVSPRKELEQRVDFVRKLHDRNALVRREARRRFLGGEGFVAWPGPAFRAFVDDFVVHNRLLSGGFVIEGHTVTLADITCPILCFVGENDEMARPAAVQAIAEAAPDADVELISVPAGHFGLVVGSRAMQITWPSVAEWIHWQEGTGPKPAALRRDSRPAEEESLGEEAELLFDTLRKTAKSAWNRLGDVAASASDALDAVRYQEPRLRRLARLSSHDRVSCALALADRVAADPDATFFLWRDRAFSYRDADTRVSNVVRGLWSCGVRAGDRVGVVMGSRPSFLTMVTALSRLNAVAVIAPPETDDRELAAGLERAEVSRVASDPEFAERCKAALGLPVLVLGGGGGSRTLPQGLIDMEAIEPDRVELPPGFEANAGRARDLAMILLRPSESGELRAAQVTNHRWALSALGAAAACTLKPDDTVYSCIPLHHPTGALVAVGAAIVSGTRLALAERFDPTRFAADVRRTGATVVFYAGEMLRSLLFEKPSRGDRSLPIRLFAGSGIRRGLAARLKERFDIGVMEFYAGTTQKVILADASGAKPGSLGRLLPGSSPVALVRCDLARRAPVRDEQGMLVAADAGEPGVLAVRLGEEDPPAMDEGAFAPGERWLLTNDVLSQDADGDYWFVDSLSAFVPTPAGAVSPRKVEDALYELPEVELAAVWSEGGDLRAAVVTRERILPTRLTEALARLAPHERPVHVAHLDAIPLTDGFRPRKRDLPRLAREAEE